MRTDTYHTIVIGAGSGGLTAAIGLAGLGKKVALIEQEHIGGDCTNSGCIPSKALLHMAHVLSSNTPPLAYVKDTIHHIRSHESEKQLMNHGVHQIIKGTASFKDNKTIHVHDKGTHTHTLTSKYIIIATGSSPRTIDIPGLPKEKILTNKTLFTLDTIPERLVVLGVGPIGCEVTYAYAKLGSKVHVIYRGNRILKTEDDDTALLVQESMEQAGVVFHWDTDNLAWDNGKLTFTEGGTKRSIDQTTYVLMALGRVPTIESLHLEHTTIAYSSKGINVNHTFQTNVKSIYAIGDVIAKYPKFTHVANAQGRVVVQHIAAPIIPTKKITTIPYAIFTKPEVATVGESLETIKQRDQRLTKQITIPLSKTDRGITDQVERGHVSVWAEILTGRILRATIAHDHAGEMIPYYTLMMHKKISLWQTISIILPYPTLSLAYNKIADTFMFDMLKNIRSYIALFAMVKGRQFIRAHWPKITAIIIWATIIIGTQQYLRSTGQTFEQLAMQFEQTISTVWYGPLAYILAYLIRPLTLFPASLITILAGRVFGLWWGLLYALIAGTLSALVPFLVGKLFANKQPDHKYEGILQYANQIKKEPFQSILILRLLYMPYDPLSFLAGTINVSLWSFMVATFVGNIVGAFIFVSLGASIEGTNITNASINPSTVIASVIVFVISIVVSRIIKNLMKRA